MDSSLTNRMCYPYPKHNAIPNGSCRITRHQQFRRICSKIASDAWSILPRTSIQRISKFKGSRRGPRALYVWAHNAPNNSSHRSFKKIASTENHLDKERRYKICVSSNAFVLWNCSENISSIGNWQIETPTNLFTIAFRWVSLSVRVLSVFRHSHRYHQWSDDRWKLGPFWSIFRLHQDHSISKTTPQHNSICSSWASKYRKEISAKQTFLLMISSMLELMQVTIYNE